MAAYSGCTIVQTTPPRWCTARRVRSKLCADIQHAVHGMLGAVFRFLVGLEVEDWSSRAGDTQATPVADIRHAVRIMSLAVPAHIAAVGVEHQARRT